MGRPPTAFEPFSAAQDSAEGVTGQQCEIEEEKELETLLSGECEKASKRKLDKCISFIYI